MRFIRLAGLLFSIAVVCLVGSAQTITTPAPSASPEDTEKTAKLNALIQQTLDEMSTGATSLRLPENRAIVDGLAGDMYWQFDQKRARDLFRTAGAELSTYNAEMEKQQAADNNTRGGGRFGGFGDFAFIGDPRFQVIPLIAKHDAGLAMQIMLQTRRQAVSEAMASTTAGTNGGRGGRGGGNGPGGGNVDATQEMILQQQIAMLAADQDPDLAVKLIKDSMANGVNAGVLPLLQKLAKLDDKKAADLGSDVVRKVVDSDMVQNQDGMRIDINFLQYSTKLQPSTDPSIKQFNFTDAQQKDLADKLVTTLMALPQSAASNNWFNQAIPLVDKIEPGRSAVLKQRQADIQSTSQANTNGRGGGQQRQNLFGPNTTADQILAQLPSIPEAQRGTAYAALGSKIGSMTDDAAAQKLVDQISDENERSNLQQNLDNSRAAKAIQAGNLDDARKQIASITDHRQQLQRYVALAIAYAQSGTENDVKTAKAILKDAKATTSPYPDNGDDLGDLMELARGYAVVEPDTAFKMVEPGVDLLNEYVQATAVLSKFNRDRQFRNGELIFRLNGQGGGGGQFGGGGGGGSVLFRYVSQIQALGKADLERANQLIDRFSRPDARMITCLYLLQGATAPPPAPTPQATSVRPNAGN